MRLIDADKLLKKAFMSEDHLQDDDIIEAGDVRKAPTVEAEPVRHGRWSKDMVTYKDAFGDMHAGFRCSECKTILNKTRYCGACGAKMDGGETE